MSIDIPDIANEVAAIAQELAAQGRVLETCPNPNSKTDFLCRLEAEASSLGTPVTVIYVPDKLLIADGGFSRFAVEFKPTPGPLETRANEIFRALNDELVPRWLQLRIGEGSHRILIEDRQPKWQNDLLLDRVERF